jgi:hypothetical protein
MKEINCDELLPSSLPSQHAASPVTLHSSRLIELSISIYFQSINFLNRSMCPALETNDESYAVGELHQSDQVMQY